MGSFRKVEYLLVLKKMTPGLGSHFIINQLVN